MIEKDAKEMSKKSFDMGRWCVLRDLAKSWYGQNLYVRETDGWVKNVESGEVMTIDDAVSEFSEMIG